MLKSQRNSRRRKGFCIGNNNFDALCAYQFTKQDEDVLVHNRFPTLESTEERTKRLVELQKEQQSKKKQREVGKIERRKRNRDEGLRRQKEKEEKRLKAEKEKEENRD